MAGLRLNAREFMRVARDPDSLVETMLQQYMSDYQTAVGESEQRSWRNSLPALAEDLAAAGLDAVDVLLEYALPLTSQRADVILAGTHPETGNPSFVVVELKQWTSAEPFEGDDALVSVTRLPEPVLHPARQVDGYRRYLTNYLVNLHDHEEWVGAVAYLHGAQNDEGVAGILEGGDVPVFTGGRREALRSYLRERLGGVGSAEVLLTSGVRPSTKLMQVAADEVRDREQFVLLGKQQLAVDMIRHEVHRAGATKRVIVVSGGPGSGELGSVREIEAFARAQGLEVVRIELDEQFRCGGSAAYVDWVEQILGLNDGVPFEAALPDDDPFVVEVVDSPWELERRLRERNDNGYTARISAGYCWQWSDAQRGGLVDDVVIGDWARPWNNKEDRRVGTAPPSALWATQEGGFDQVGCVYTAQGFEFDWAGVIIGPDLVWRDGCFETVRSANKDPHFRNPKTVPDEDFDLLVRHVYKVLLTRGMIGTILYSPDAQTREALRALLN